MCEGGETVSNTLKGGGTEKRGGEKDFKKGGQAGSTDGCLKEGGPGTLSQTMLHLNRLHKLHMLLYVIHASAAFKGGDIQSFGEGRRTFSILCGDLITS